jgi:dipeptidyl aminopeptidase/acylaminoacyl peptidase
MACLAILSLAMGASASPPPAPLGPEVYGRLPNIEMMRLSPSGEKLAYITVAGDHRGLIVKDLSGAVLFNASLADNKIRDIDWAGDDHLLVTASSTRGFFDEHLELYQTVAINLITRKSFMVFETNPSIMHDTFGFHRAVSQGGHWFGFIGGVTLSKTRGFDATFNDYSFVDLYRVDLDTGEAAIKATGQQRQHEWALDDAAHIVAHSEYAQDTADWTLRADSQGDRLVTTFNEPLGEVGLAGLGRTPGTVVVAKKVPEEWSLSDGPHVPLPSDGLIEGYMHDQTTGRLVGVWLAGDRWAQQFYDPLLKARQTAFRKALGDTVRIASWSADFKRMILFTQGDGDAGTYWLVDGKTVKPYGYSYPEIPDANVGPTRVVIYKAADGLEIHGILTLPPGREAKALPLVVLPHGGPQGQDAVGFDWWAQAFAGRGYAVFQPNFRGSDGYGRDFRDAGFGQWGRKMQTDISDGVAELARQGVIDPKRACIVGASYGGYAALAGVTLQQGLYRCAVSYGGISDLNYFLDRELGDDRNAGARYLRKFLGAGSNYAAAMREISPVRFAARADAPILLIHGEADSVVPIGQSREMERVLHQAGKPVEFVLLKGEDHWLSRDATRKAMLAASVAFVEKYNPIN